MNRQSRGSFLKSVLSGFIGYTLHDF